MFRFYSFTGKFEFQNDKIQHKNLKTECTNATRKETERDRFKIHCTSPSIQSRSNVHECDRYIASIKGLMKRHTSYKEREKVRDSNGMAKFEDNIDSKLLYYEQDNWKKEGKNYNACCFPIQERPLTNVLTNIKQQKAISKQLYDSLTKESYQRKSQLEHTPYGLSDANYKTDHSLPRNAQKCNKITRMNTTMSNTLENKNHGIKNHYEKKRKHCSYQDTKTEYEIINNVSLSKRKNSEIGNDWQRFTNPNNLFENSKKNNRRNKHYSHFDERSRIQILDKSKVQRDERDNLYYYKADKNLWTNKRSFDFSECSLSTTDKYDKEKEEDDDWCSAPIEFTNNPSGETITEQKLTIKSRKDIDIDDSKIIQIAKLIVNCFKEDQKLPKQKTSAQKINNISNNDGMRNLSSKEKNAWKVIDLRSATRSREKQCFYKTDEILNKKKTKGVGRFASEIHLHANYAKHHSNKGFRTNLPDKENEEKIREISVRLENQLPLYDENAHLLGYLKEGR